MNQDLFTFVILIVVVLFQLLRYILKKTTKPRDKREGTTASENPTIGQRINEYLAELEKRAMPTQQQAPPNRPPRQRAPARPQPQSPPQPQSQRPAPQPVRPPVRSGEPAPDAFREPLTTVDDRHLVNTTDAEVRTFTETIAEDLGGRDISTLHYELDEHREAPRVLVRSSSRGRTRLQKILRRKSIRDAIMLREILGPPIALRERESEG